MEKTTFIHTLEEPGQEMAARMGGKAATLAKLTQLNFPVPPGFVIFSRPKTESEWSSILSWWTGRSCPKVAVRSSASGEDSADFSYAGQFLTILQVDTESHLRKAIDDCFDSVSRISTQAYAKHFSIGEIPMHVLVQTMIQSVFSGVFFSEDPRGNNSGWLIEAVAGQGEQLVSAQVTPFRFSENRESDSSGDVIPSLWRDEYLKEILFWGKKAQGALGYKADIEWAIDGDGKFWILQSRPITTVKKQNEATYFHELERIRGDYAADTTWDGHTFAEWTGTPTEFTFQLWQQAFSSGKAFDKALKAIGYLGINGHQGSKSLLNRIFGRAYLNLKMMEPIYFGDSPYEIDPNPRPHLTFKANKISLKNLLRAPSGIARMIRVAWRVQTSRHEFSQKALSISEQNDFREKDPFALKVEVENLSLAQLGLKMRNLFNEISEHHMQGPFLITLLIESSTQGLNAILNKDLGEARANEISLHLLGEGIQTVASEMHQLYSDIQGSEELWRSFLAKYGHRGMGELELSHPRWIETKLLHLQNRGGLKNSPEKFDIQSALKEISKIRKPILLQEIEELKKLLIIREQIKMTVMKGYALLRWVLVEIGKKTGLGDQIFWLRIEEIEALIAAQVDVDSLLKKAQLRFQLIDELKTVDLPMSFSLRELLRVLETDERSDSSLFHGVTLSPGVSAGRVHIVSRPELEDLNSWPEDVILVAEATDPGWTPLFERARAVVVARGGVLSHCAIVAREMGLPAVGEIRGASHIFREGERVWVDGNHGTVSKSN